MGVMNVNFMIGEYIEFSSFVLIGMVGVLFEGMFGSHTYELDIESF